MPITLYNYYRSSTSYRTRIALNIKGVAYDVVAVNLLKNEHKHADYLVLNPSGGVPALKVGEQVLTQAHAILEYLEERWPQPPLLPKNLEARANIRALCQIIACDIHPVNNTSVQHYLTETLGHSETEKMAWIAHWQAKGLAAFEAMIKPIAGTYCYGDQLTMADVSLIPQLFNARRFECDLAPYPTLLRIEAACLALPAFEKAHPMHQPDAI